MGKRFAVIGLGRFGSSVAATLLRLGAEVVGIDLEPDKLHDVKGLVPNALLLDATDEDAVRSLDVSQFAAVIVAIGDVQNSTLITVLLRDLGARTIIAKASGDEHGKILVKVGADRVVYPEREMGLRVARNVSALNNFLDYTEVAPNLGVVEVAVTADMVGSTLRNLDFPGRCGVNVVAIKRPQGIGVSPRAEDVLGKGDRLVVVGPSEGLRKLEKLSNGH
ncbi:MAG: TrkA family potassium uptake protein [Bacillota bacterium]